MTEIENYSVFWRCPFGQKRVNYFFTDPEKVPCIWDIAVCHITAVNEICEQSSSRTIWEFPFHSYAASPNCRGVVCFSNHATLSPTSRGETENGPIESFERHHSHPSSLSRITPPFVSFLQLATWAVWGMQCEVTGGTSWLFDGD